MLLKGYIVFSIKWYSENPNTEYTHLHIEFPKTIHHNAYYK